MADEITPERCRADAQWLTILQLTICVAVPVESHVSITGQHGYILVLKPPGYPSRRRAFALYSHTRMLENTSAYVVCSEP